MKNYLRNEIIIKENEYINKIFEILKGEVKEDKTNKIYTKGEFLFLDRIYNNPYSPYTYTSLNLVSGKWLSKNELTDEHIKILAQMYQTEKAHNELISINDPLIKLARYLLYEYKKNKTFSFYLSYKISELSTYLNINKKSLSDALNHLSSKQIISRHNKLFNILNYNSLEKYAYLNDYEK